MTHPLELIAATYAQVPYTSHSFPMSHPGRARALGRLFGHEAPPVETARILELGCASGGNLIPLALALPQASCTGIDLAPGHVAAAKEGAAALGLANCTFLQGDLASVELRGPFDYIICHGVFSWVPTDVQEAILRRCKEWLSPAGIAYMSYNTYPGWKLLEVVRDAMRLRGGTSADFAAQLPLGRGMIDFLRAQSPQGSILRQIMDHAHPLIAGADPHYVLHDFLEPFNQPCYFLDFMGRAQAQGLGYLADAALATMFAGNHPPAISGPLLAECGHDQIVMEQYLDFVTARQFRSTLLIHDGARQALSYQLDPVRLEGLHFAGRFAPSNGTDSNDRLTLNGSALAFNDPGGRAMADALHAVFPATLSLDDLRRIHAGAPGAADFATLIGGMLQTGALWFSASPVRAAPASVLGAPSVRLRLKRGTRSGAGRITGPWHESAPVAPEGEVLLDALEQPATRSDLQAALMDALASGRLLMLRNGAGAQVTEQERSEAASSLVTSVLTRLQVLGVLEAAPPQRRAAARR